MFITNERDEQLYQLMNDDMRRSWSLVSIKHGHTWFVFEQGTSHSSIKFTYLGNAYTVKRSAWSARYVVSSTKQVNHRYRYLWSRYKGYLYVDGIEQSYYDEDSQIIATSEENTIFLLLIQLAIYIIMHQ